MRVWGFGCCGWEGGGGSIFLGEGWKGWVTFGEGGGMGEGIGEGMKLVGRGSRFGWEVKGNGGFGKV
ncbi:uncharacterized protein G2W53_023053 [Senna tora]|uniref:Uncharacterized protein n=1 Tax=Senna tora TaxID=362788 RepID=A0A834TVE5_9FABA|nr:uncharacterized protein G2W53_023053 [Senna tora]